MRKRLFWNTLVISAVVLTVFGLIGAVAADLWYTRLMVDELRKDTILLASQIENAAEDFPAFAARNPANLSIGRQLCPGDADKTDGAVLGDSSADWQTMENHRDRPEVVEAFKNGWGTSQRYSNTLKVKMLYVAVL